MPCRKWTGFFSLLPHENDGLISLLYGATNANFPRLNDFLGVSQITAPDEFFHWQPRRTFLPLVTAGQKPVFLDDAGTLRAMTQPEFDGGKKGLSAARSKIAADSYKPNGRPYSEFTIQGTARGH